MKTIKLFIAAFSLLLALSSFHDPLYGQGFAVGNPFLKVSFIPEPKLNYFYGRVLVNMGKQITCCPLNHLCFGAELNDSLSFQEGEEA